MARTMTMAEANQIAQKRIAELERELRQAKKWKSQCEAYDKAYKALREAIQNVLDGNYPHALKYEQCKHGLYGYDYCGQCVDDYLQAALESQE